MISSAVPGSHQGHDSVRKKIDPEDPYPESHAQEKILERENLPEPYR